MKKTQGFSLVELMVALVIGLIVVLAAGQLFVMALSVFNDARKVSEKQSVVNFVSDILIYDFRKASGVSDLSGEPLDGNASTSIQLTFDRGYIDEILCVDGSVQWKSYYLFEDEAENVYMCMAHRCYDESMPADMGVDCQGQNEQPLLSGFVDVNNSFYVEDAQSASSSWEIFMEFLYPGSADSYILAFSATLRSRVLSSVDSD